MSLFRQLVAQASNQPSLSTLRVKCFLVGAWITKPSRKRIQKKRPWLDASSQKLILYTSFYTIFQTHFPIPNAKSGFI